MDLRIRRIRRLELRNGCNHSQLNGLGVLGLAFYHAPLNKPTVNYFKIGVSSCIVPLEALR